MSEYLRLMDQYGVTKLATVQQSNNWNTGYHIFREYLKRHLEANGKSLTEESIIMNIPQGNEGSFLPYHLNVELLNELQDMPCSDMGVVVNLGFNQGGSVVAEELKEAIKPFKFRIFVAHDVKLAFGLLGKTPHFYEHNMCLDWSPAYYRMFGDDNHYTDVATSLPEAHWELMSLNDSYLFVPSKYMKEWYESAFREHDIPILLAPHPMKELLGLFKPLQLTVPQREKAMLVSSVYKSDVIQMFSFIEQMIPEGYKFYIPSPNDSIDPEWFSQYINNGDIDVLNPCTHSQLLNMMGRVEAYVDFSRYKESFGFMAREALEMGAKVYTKIGSGALDEILCYHFPNVDHLIDMFLNPDPL